MIDTSIARTMGAKLAARFEGFSATPYHGADDKPDVWTIGYGSIRDADGNPVTPDTPAIDRDTALAWLTREMSTMADVIDEYVVTIFHDNPAEIRDCEWAALYSFAYEEGAEALLGSTLMKYFIVCDYDKAADYFAEWCYSNGKPSRGIKVRREIERQVFNGKNDVVDYNDADWDKYYSEILSEFP